MPRALTNMDPTCYEPRRYCSEEGVARRLPTPPLRFVFAGDGWATLCSDLRLPNEFRNT